MVIVTTGVGSDLLGAVECDLHGVSDSLNHWRGGWSCEELRPGLFSVLRIPLVI
jgi:hypothetical protein